MTGSIQPPRRKRSRSRRPPSIATKKRHRLSVKATHTAARSVGACINENQQGTHGPAVIGCRCAPCDATHMASSHRIPVSAKFAGVKRAKFEDAIRRALDAEGAK